MVFVESVRCVWFEQMDRTVFFTSVKVSLSQWVTGTLEATGRTSCVQYVPPLGGDWGHTPPENFGDLRHSEIGSGTFWDIYHPIKYRVLYIMYVNYFSYSNFP